MKRFVVVSNPRDTNPRRVPAFRPVVFPPSRNAFLNRPKPRKKARRNVPITTALNSSKSRKARRNVGPLPVTTAYNRRRARRNVTPLPITTALNSRRKSRRTRSARVIPIFVARSVNRRRSGSSVRNRRGRSANNGGQKMATAKQKAWRRVFAARYGGKKPSRKRRTARRNKRGRPLSGKVYRPSLPPRRKVRAIIRTFKKSWKKKHGSVGRRTAKKRRKRARKNSVYTVFNNSRHKRRLSSRKARGLAMKRWHGRKSRRGRRNPDIMGTIKSVASLGTVQQGLAVLAGAVVATGAPSLLPKFNTGWGGILLSLAAAGLAGVVASYVSPKHMAHIAAGGVVVVGLRLVAQFAPRALLWSPGSSGAQAGFLLPATRTRSGVGGYLMPPPGAISFGRGRVSGFARAAGEGFKSPKV